MGAEAARVFEVVVSFIERSEHSAEGVTAQTGLWGDGLQLDSLEAAELSATLEDEFGRDPFTASDDLPETIADILAFYEAAPAK